MAALIDAAAGGTAAVRRLLTVGCLLAQSGVHCRVDLNAHLQGGQAGAVSMGEEAKQTS